MRALFIAAALALTTLPAMADQLTIDRIVNGGSLSGPAPMGLQLSPDGQRVTFLRAKAGDQHTFDLWEYRLKDGSTQLLVDSRTLAPEGEHYSDAEKARRERARTAGLHGIIDYQWSPDGSKLLFPIAGTLYLYDLSAPAAKAVLKLDTGGDAIDPKIS
ncbi:MAG TPA: S9 family peptidase, partial [Rhodanobacteraceae bacterium]|nr:S9 family peptidase [Rhodanobacteraceae bacterium]